MIWLYWLLGIIVFSIIEALTTALVSAWFVGGCLAGLIAYFLGASIEVQIIVAVIVSLLGFLLVFKFIRPHLLKKRPIEATNADRVIGQKGVVMQRIDKDTGSGQVYVLGQLWSARSENDEPIECGRSVIVSSLSGVKVLVHEVEADTTTKIS